MSVPRLETLLLDWRGSIAVLTLNRPEKKNSLNRRMRRELIRAFEFLADDKRTGAMVLYGGEDTFCAGFDREELMALIEKGDSRDAKSFAKETIAFQESVLRFPKLLIAAISGYALGGGFDLAMFCHLRVASETAVFGHPEIGFGACPLFFPYYAILGRGKALELTLATATRNHFVDAKQAFSLGIVNRLSNKGAVLEDSVEFAKEIMRSPAFAISLLLKASNFALDLAELNRRELDFVARETARALRRTPSFPSIMLKQERNNLGTP
jgi:enoyl-CoA hydratase/carnithine racemase